MTTTFVITEAARLRRQAANDLALAAALDAGVGIEMPRLPGLGLDPNCVLDVVPLACGVTRREMVAPGRGIKRVVVARQVAMLILRRESYLSYPHVSRVLRRRHHAAVMHGERIIERRMIAEPKFGAFVRALIEAIKRADQRLSRL